MTQSIAQFVDESVTFTPAVLEATAAYSRSKPWQGTYDDQREKLAVYHAAMCEACDVSCGLQFLGDNPEIPSAGDYHSHEGENMMVLVGKVSVVTYLFWFASTFYTSPKDRMKFALNLYRVGFPRSFAARDLSGPTVR